MTRLRLGPLGASFSDDVVLAPAPGDRNPGTLRSSTDFGDDLPAGRRIGVRVRLTAEPDGALLFDDSDSDPAPDAPLSFRITPPQVRDATAAAVRRVLGESPDRPFSIETDPASWVGAPVADEDSAAVAFAMSRVYDTALGAMANAWPSAVGAGSCSLGAIVRLRSDGETVDDVLAGGEGGTPQAAGRDAHPGPFCRPVRASTKAWSCIESLRVGSGGVGARPGGAGVMRVYTMARDTHVWVAMDRITNPPHGIDRAGPPQPAELWIAVPRANPRRVAAWTPHELRAGSTLTVKTAGGGGHGFPGWGVDWDPDAQ